MLKKEEIAEYIELAGGNPVAGGLFAIADALGVCAKRLDALGFDSEARHLPGAGPGAVEKVGMELERLAAAVEELKPQ